MATWLWQVHLVVADADREAANQMAVDVGPGGEAELLTFGVPLRTPGAQGITHWGCCTAMTTPMLIAAQPVLASGTIPSARAYRLNRAGDLKATNSPTLGILDQPWTWEQTLLDMGLEEVHV